MPGEHNKSQYFLSVYSQHIINEWQIFIISFNYSNYNVVSIAKISNVTFINDLKQSVLNIHYNFYKPMINVQGKTLIKIRNQ